MGQICKPIAKSGLIARLEVKGLLKFSATTTSEATAETTTIAGTATIATKHNNR